MTKPKKEETKLAIISDMSLEISEQFDLTLDESVEIVKSFQSIALRMKSADDELKGFGKPTKIDKAISVEAKRIRNVFVKIRTSAGNVHKDIKAEILKKSNAIDKAKNNFFDQIRTKEIEMKGYEDIYEKEQARIAEEKKEGRIKMLEEVGFTDGKFMDFSALSDKDFSVFVDQKKEEIEIEAKRLADIEIARVEQEAKAEKERLELEDLRAKKIEADEKIAKLEADKIEQDKKLGEAKEPEKKAEPRTMGAEEKRHIDTEFPEKPIEPEKKETFLAFVKRIGITKDMLVKGDYKIVSFTGGKLIYKLTHTYDEKN